MVEIVEPWALPNLIAGLTSAVVALILFIQRPGGIQNLAAAAFVWFSGFGWAILWGLLAFRSDLWVAKTAYLSWTLAVLAYLWLLSTLDSPLARPLAKRPVRIAYTAGCIFLAAAIVGSPLIYGYDPDSGMYTAFFFDIGWTLIMLFGVVVALFAWKRAPPGLLRRKNAAFALAFIVHDVLMVLLLGTTWAAALLYPWLAAGLGFRVLAIPGFTLLVFQGLLLYGILSTQLFDIDLKLRLGLSRGTVGAVFVAAFFAASEIVAALLTPAVGVVAGILTTAFLIVALAPLRRAADALAALVVRDAADTPAYRRQRKEMVYVAQVEELMADANITAKERRALLRLQETLGLDAAVAARLERDVLDRLVPAAVVMRRADA